MASEELEEKKLRFDRSLQAKEELV